MPEREVGDTPARQPGCLSIPGAWLSPDRRNEGHDTMRAPLLPCRQGSPPGAGAGGDRPLGQEFTRASGWPEREGVPGQRTAVGAAHTWDHGALCFCPCPCQRPQEQGQLGTTVLHLNI